MALVLTLKDAEDIYIGAHHVTLKVGQAPAAKATLTDEAGEAFPVGTEKWVTLFPGCDVRLTLTQPSHREVRMQFEAPDFTVLRGTSYRKPLNTRTQP